MATNTTNYNLSKPAYSDTADINVINGNMDKVDTALDGLGSGLAIISKNNTHAAITAGQYVYVHGHGSLAEGLYTANSNISANGTLSSSNLTAVSGGGLNKLFSDLNSKFVTSVQNVNQQAADLTATITFPSGQASRVEVTLVGNGSSRCYKALVSTSTQGAVYVAEIYKGSNITVATGDNVMEITRDANACIVIVENYSMSVPDPVVT